MNAFLTARYVVLTFFTICCIVVAGAAAWNMTETREFAPVATVLQVDTFLIVQAIFGILAVFVFVPIEILSKSAITSRVWFEVVWISLFWILNLSGAAAVTATGRGDSCPPITRLAAWMDACKSVTVLQAFSWLSTIILLVYLATFVVCTLISSAGNSRIWQLAVRDVVWFSATQQEIRSRPSSPDMTAIREKQVPVYNIGLQPEAVLYHKYATPKDAPQDKSTSLTVPAVQRARTSDVVPSPQSQTDTPPLYPQFFQPGLQAQAAVQQGPSPAGQWASPNSDAPAQQSAASSPASTTSSSASPTSTSSSSSGLKPLVLQTSAAPAPRPKLVGPRPKHRPPPLNLTGLSSFNSAGKRPDRAPRK